MRICGVYLIVSPSGRKYVGSSVNIEYRWKLYRRLNCDRQKLLYNSLKKYTPGKHSFSILFKCSESDMFDWERIFGDLYLSLQKYGGLNLSLPKSGDRPYEISDETRIKLSENAKKFYEENPESISRFKEGAKRFRANHPDKVKQIQDKATQALRTPEYRSKRSIIAKEISSRPEIRKASSDRMKKRFEDPEERKAQSERTKKFMAVPGNHPLSRKVINIETGEIFPCLEVVRKMIGYSSGTMSRTMLGERKNDTPYRYLEDIKNTVDASNTSK